MGNHYSACVGYPLADRCSTYAIYDTDKSRVTIRRLPVDLAAYEAALQKNDVAIPLWLHDAVVRGEVLAKSTNLK